VAGKAAAQGSQMLSQRADTGTGGWLVTDMDEEDGTEDHTLTLSWHQQTHNQAAQLRVGQRLVDMWCKASKRNR
jgi:hypothetical protein